MAMARFNRAQKLQAQAQSSEDKPKASRYGGVKAAAPRPGYPHVGKYRFRVLSSTEGRNPKHDSKSFKQQFEIVEVYECPGNQHSPGDVVFVSHRISGEGSSFGVQRVVAQVEAQAGYETDEEYQAFDPDGLFIDACVGKAVDDLGRPNPYTAAGLTLTNRLVDVCVTRGKQIGDTEDYYREYEWFVVPDDEQDAKGEYVQTVEMPTREVLKA